MRFFLRWMIPPLLGLGGFMISRGAPGLKTGSGDPERMHTSLEARPDSVSALERELEELRERGDLARKLFEEETALLSGIALRGRIEGLLKKYASFDDDTDWQVVEKTETALFVALFELGKREGKAGAEWIDEHAPERRGHVMAGWAEVDPDAALDAVLASKRKPPCFPETAMELLEHRAKAGPDALRSACSRFPWELLLAGKLNTYGDELLFQPSMDVKPWLESGAAEILARDGIPLSGFFTAWAGSDPAGALAGLDTWDDVRLPYPRLVSELLAAGSQQEDLRANILRELEALPEEKLTRIADGVVEFGKGNSGRRELFFKLYPILEHASSEAE
jgi:hypothetical protein